MSEVATRIATQLSRLPKTMADMIREIPRHLVVTGSAWISRLVMATVQILSIRLLLGGLGSERYAAYVVLSALLNWYMLADMGVGTSLQNYMSEQRAKGLSGAHYLALGALISGVLLVFLVALLYYLSPYLAPALLKHFGFLSIEQKSRDFFISGVIFLGTGIGSIAYKTWYAQHKGYLSNIMPALASLIGLGLVWMVMQQEEAGDRLLLGLVAFTLPSAIVSIASFLSQLRGLPSSSWRFRQDILSPMARRSGSFWVIRAMAAGVLSVDYIIMSQYLPASEIVTYGITAKIFALAAFLYTSLYAALWPHFTEAITINDWASVKHELKKSFLFGVSIVLMVTLFLWAFMPDVIRILSPNEALLIPSSFILLFGGYHLLLVWVHGYAIILQSMSDTRVLLVWTAVQAGLSIFFQILLVQKIGIYGIVLGLILSFLMTAVWVVPKRVFYHFKMSMRGAS